MGLDSILNHEHDGVREQWRAELEDEHLANPNLLAQPEQVSELFKRCLGNAIGQCNRVSAYSQES